MRNIVFTTAVLFGITTNVGLTAEIPSDDENYQGDRLSFPVRIEGEYKPFDSDDYKKVCIPAGTTLRGLGKTDDGSYVNVRLRKPYISFKDEVSVECDGKAETIPDDVAIRINKSDLHDLVPDRFGLTYGALVVPFKYHFGGSKSFEGNSTVGPFLGYRFDKSGYGFGVKAIAFVGGAAIRVNRNDENGGDNDETLAGFSYGVGLLGTVKSEFQLGVVVGQDRVSDGSDYEDNGEWWGAVALGFSFAN